MHIPNNLLKGSLQTIILNLLKENDRMYGYEITQKVKEITSGEIKLTEGAMYPALHKMEAEGLLETSTEQVENRTRKYYTLTSAGLEALEIKVQETTSFMENLKLLLNLKPERS
jgi:PadR family transcriptional regulator PadR